MELSLSVNNSFDPVFCSNAPKVVAFLGIVTFIVYTSKSLVLDFSKLDFKKSSFEVRAFTLEEDDLRTNFSRGRLRKILYRSVWLLGILCVTKRSWATLDSSKRFFAILESCCFPARARFYCVHSPNLSPSLSYQNTTGV